MFSTLFTVALFAASALTGVFADDELSVNTPSIKQCTPVKLTWEAGTAPYNMLVVPADDPCSDPISDLGDHNLTYFTWTPAVKAGTQIMLSLEDADGVEGWSGPITVGDGPSDCLSNKAVSVSGSASDASDAAYPTDNAYPTVAGAAEASPSSSETAQIMGGASNNGPFASSASTSQVNVFMMVGSILAATYALL